MLARQGAEVTLFEHGRRPELVVGESLVPAVIPMLRRLGIEKEIAAIGLLKPGASFVWSPTDRFSFTFARFAPAVPPYAYNVPRPRFDEVLLANAVASGARVVRTRARVERASRNTGTEIRLAAETLTAAPIAAAGNPTSSLTPRGAAGLSLACWIYPLRSVHAMTWHISPISRGSGGKKPPDRSSFRASRQAGAGAFRYRTNYLSVSW